MNRLGNISKLWITPIMIACAEVDALGNANMILDYDRLNIIKPNRFTNPTMISDRQEPRKFYPNIRLNPYSCAYLRSKQAQEPNFETRYRYEIATD
jgi:hypothetical protein